MLNDGQSKRILELEAEVKSLRQQLIEANEIIGTLNKKLHPAKSNEPHVASEPKGKKAEPQGTHGDGDTIGENEISLQEIAYQLHDFVCKDKAARLEKHIKSETLLNVISSSVAIKEVEADINAIIETVGWTEGILIANWNKSLVNSDASSQFAMMLPVFFRVLGAWRTAKLNLNHKKVKQLQDLKFDHHAYKLLFDEIMPALVKNKAKAKAEARVKAEADAKAKAKAKVERKEAKELRARKIAHDAKIKKQYILKEANWLRLYNLLKSHLASHSPTLLRNYRKAYKVNEYGAVEKDERGPEIDRFFRSIGLYDFDGLDPYCAQKASDLTKRWCEIQIRASAKDDAAPENGHEFEHWVAAQLERAGWKATITQASGDDGVDVIAEREGLSVAVQCKRYKGSVGNKAVQEVYSGMKHMGLDRAVVISTGKYTKAAQNLASTTDVLLLSEHDIQHLREILSVKPTFPK